MEISPVGVVRSALTDPAAAPRQGAEGAGQAWIDLLPGVRAAAADLRPGDCVVLLTWLHLADRTTLTTHPRNDPAAPLTGVFSTRSPDRPNPIGLHPVTVVATEEGRLLVEPLEAVDGTPVVDIKIELPHR